MSGSEDKTIGFVEGIERKTQKNPHCTSNAVNSVVISRDGEYLGSVSGDMTIRLWRLSNFY